MTTTTPPAGAGLGDRPHQAGQSQLQELTDAESLGLLRSRRLGRVAYADDDGPAVMPVHYVVDGDTVLFRTSPYGSLGRHVRSSPAAFEVDDIDDETGAGWSVVVRGRATFVDPGDLPESDARPTAWRDREGAQSLHVRVSPTSISGRQIILVPSVRDTAAGRSGDTS